jgi:hypothetical protein
MGGDYWNRDFGKIGLKNPWDMTDLAFRSAPYRAMEYWGTHVLDAWKCATTQGSEKEDFYRELLQLSPDADLEGPLKEYALTNFGRVIHLLQDMGVPAHVNNDPHAAIDWLDMLVPDSWLEGGAEELANYLGIDDIGTIDDDDFEDYVGKVCKNNSLPWTADPNRQTIFFNPDWKTLDFSLHFATVTSLFDSDDVDGQGSGKPYRWDSFLVSSDFHRDITWDLTDYACKAIAESLIPMSYSFTAGLYLKFLQEIGVPLPQMFFPNVKLKKVIVHDDMDPMASGEIYINFRVEDFKKRFGRYKMNSGESREISDLGHSYMLDQDSPLKVHFDVYDDDSWYFQPSAKDRLGTVELNVLPDEWQQWLNKPKFFSLPTDKGKATIEFEIEVISNATGDPDIIRSKILPIEQIEREHPMLEFSTVDRERKLHWQHCHHLKNVAPENLARIYLNHDEIKKRRSRFNKEPAAHDNELLKHIFEGEIEDKLCKTCYKLWNKRN